MLKECVCAKNVDKFFRYKDLVVEIVWQLETDGLLMNLRVFGRRDQTFLNQVDTNTHCLGNSFRESFCHYSTLGWFIVNQGD
jgi:hypothetical protein